MKVLGTLDVCGVEYIVKCGDVNDYDVLDGAYGACCVGARTIWVHSGLPTDKTIDTLTHEAVHALLAESGVLQTTEAVFETDNLHAWEEAMVRILTPHIARLFGPPQLKKAGRGRK